MDKNNSAFTLVELIIVITILSVLATIGFVSFSTYTALSRDTVRLSSIVSIEKGINNFQIGVGKYPLPDNQNKVMLAGKTISHFGIIGKEISEKIGISRLPLDPKDQTHFYYSTNSKQTSYQLLTFFEQQTSLFFSKTYASNLFPKTLGLGVGILLDENKKVFTNDLDLYQTHSGTVFNLIVPGIEIQKLLGKELGGLEMLTEKGANYEPPSVCKEGFVAVPGNPEFLQPGFCVAKYEMSYKLDIMPNSCEGIGCPGVPENTSSKSDWNTINYMTGVEVVSMPGKYPITGLTQLQAIESCKNIGGHLVTNNQWMTIARNIESISQNWSSGLVGSGFISNGVSNHNYGCGTGNTTKTQYSNLPRRWATKTGAGFGNETCDKKRQLILSNGNVIWDFSGNVREHINEMNDLDGTQYKKGKYTFDLTYNNWNQSPTGVNHFLQWHKSGWNALSIPEDIRKQFGPKTPNLNHLTNGMGNIHGWYTDLASYPDNIFLRGGGAYHDVHSGIYTLSLHWGPGRTSRHVGFRCAY